VRPHLMHAPRLQHTARDGPRVARWAVSVVRHLLDTRLLVTSCALRTATDAGCFAALSYTMRAPTTGLLYPDMTILYKVVLTRIHRWADQIIRRVEKDNSLVRRGAKRRRSAAATLDLSKPGKSEKRSLPERNMQTRGVMLPIMEGEDDDDDFGDEVGEGGGGLDGDDDGGAGEQTESETMPPAAELGSGRLSVPGVPSTDIAAWRSLPWVSTAGRGPRPRAPGTAPVAAATGGGGGGAVGNVEAVAALLSQNSDTLPAFAAVAHVFQAPGEHLVDFQALLSIARRVVMAASAACGLASTYSGVFTRFSRKLAADLSGGQSSLQCVALYNALHDFAATSQHYAILQTIDMYLAE
jgi:hypothetical protein